MKFTGADAGQSHRRKELRGEVHGREEDAIVAIADATMQPGDVNSSIDAKDKNQNKGQKRPAKNVVIIRILQVPVPDPAAHAPGSAKIHEKGQSYQEISDPWITDKVRHPREDNVNVGDHQRLCNFGGWSL